MLDSENEKQPFKIFRAAEAPTLDEAACMTTQPFAPEIMDLLMKAGDTGLREGEEVRVLVNIPGFSLTHVWFKKDFPLPLHSHDADCLYYIVAGSLKMGKETLGPRDCFFIPTDAPYTYRPGPEGVELLEFRHKTKFNFVNHANGVGFWAKAIETAKANRADWKTEKMPALNT
jgi:hypothetical protein